MNHETVKAITKIVLNNNEITNDLKSNCLSVFFLAIKRFHVRSMYYPVYSYRFENCHKTKKFDIVILQYLTKQRSAQMPNYK